MFVLQGRDSLINVYIKFGEEEKLFWRQEILFCNLQHLDYLLFLGLKFRSLIFINVCLPHSFRTLLFLLSITFFFIYWPQQQQQKIWQIYLKQKNVNFTLNWIKRNTFSLAILSRVKGIAFCFMKKETNSKYALRWCCAQFNKGDKD